MFTPRDGIGGGMDRKMEGLKNKNSKILGTWFFFFLPLRAPSPSPFKPMAIPLQCHQSTCITISTLCM